MRKRQAGEQIDRLAGELQDRLVELRRDIYMHPELSGREYRTAGLVAGELTRLGLKVSMTPDKTGVIGMLEGARPGPVLAYRADMDALPMADAINAPYRSRVEGVKHGCGHDVHTTVGLGVATVLTSLKEQLHGSVKFIFQPAEEAATGAKLMIDCGVFQDPSPDLIFALHTSPAPVGTIECNLGTAFWGLRILTVRVTGSDDELKQLSPSLEAAVRKLADVLPDGVQISEQDLGLGLERGFLLMPTGPASVKAGAWEMRCVAKAPDDQGFALAQDEVSKALGDTLAVECHLHPLLPPVVNTFQVVNDASALLAEAIGRENVNLLQQPISPLGSEDFAFYLEQLPGAIFWLGVANGDRGISGAIHTPEFDVDEACLVTGTRAMAYLIYHHLQQPQ